MVTFKVWGEVLIVESVFEFIIIRTMHSLRFEAQDIFIMEKTVQFCGSMIPTSKKKVVWVIKHGEEVHTIICWISLYSGKKKVTHNGSTIVSVADSKDTLDFLVTIGGHRMIFIVDSKTELVNIERKYTAANDEFTNFRNVYSQPVGKVYETYFEYDW